MHIFPSLKKQTRKTQTKTACVCLKSNRKISSDQQSYKHFSTFYTMPFCFVLKCVEPLNYQFLCAVVETMSNRGALILFYKQGLPPPGITSVLFSCTFCRAFIDQFCLATLALRIYVSDANGFMTEACHHSRWYRKQLCIEVRL